MTFVLLTETSYVMVSTINTHDFDYTKECSTFFNNCK